MKQAHAFVAGAGMINVDLIYGGLEHIPAEGEEVFSQHFQMRLGGGIPATLLNLRGLNVPVSIQTALGNDLFSHFAAEEIRRFGTAPLNLYHGSSIPLNISSVLLTQRDRTFVSYTGGAGQAGSYDDAIYRASTGAGDAFTAGLLYGLYHGYSFAECVLFGNITGGKCVTGVGCLTERCTEPELLELFHRYRPSIA